MKRVLSIISTLLIGAGFFGALNARAQEQADTNPDPVLVFNRVCYAQVPNVDAIQTMAQKLAWRTMAEEQVKEFDVYENASAVLGWEAQVGERLFQVGVVQAPAPAKMLADLEGFDKATVTTCSLILDDQQIADDFMANMQKLAGKEPVSDNVTDALFTATTWAGGNDQLKVFLVGKASKTGRGGLLNVTVVQK